MASASTPVRATVPPDINAKVRQEMGRFRSALPELLRSIPGKWVVFKDGKVCGTFKSSKDAHLDGLRQFGRMGGQVIAQIVKEEPVPISAGAMFGLP